MKKTGALDKNLMPLFLKKVESRKIGTNSLYNLRKEAKKLPAM